MNLQNGYKVIYEKAVDGKRTFYASKSTAYPNTDDVALASFNDVDYRGKVIYECKGKFYVSKGAVPAYDENGEPTDTVIEGFDEVFVKAEDNVAPASEEPAAVEEPANYSRRASRKTTPVVEEPVVEEPVVEEPVVSENTETEE